MTADKNGDPTKDLLNIETNILGVLKKLEEIEKNKGLGSQEYRSICLLLQDFLVEEENSVIKIMQNSGLFKYMISRLEEKEILSLNEVLFSFIFDIDDTVLYRINKLLTTFSMIAGKLERDSSLEASLMEKININFLAKTDDLSIKYKLAFADPSFCYDMAQNYFNSNLLCPTAFLIELEKDPFYEANRSGLLLKKFCEIIGFMVLNQDSITEEHYNFLDVVESYISYDQVIYAIFKMSLQDIPFTKLTEIYQTLQKRKIKNKIKSLNNNKNPLTTK